MLIYDLHNLLLLRIAVILKIQDNVSQIPHFLLLLVLQLRVGRINHQYLYQFSPVALDALRKRISVHPVLDSCKSRYYLWYLRRKSIFKLSTSSFSFSWPPLMSFVLFKSICDPERPSEFRPLNLRPSPKYSIEWSQGKSDTWTVSERKDTSSASRLLV